MECQYALVTYIFTSTMTLHNFTTLMESKSSAESTLTGRQLAVLGGQPATLRLFSFFRDAGLHFHQGLSHGLHGFEGCSDPKWGAHFFHPLTETFDIG